MTAPLNPDPAPATGSPATEPRRVLWRTLRWIGWETYLLGCDLVRWFRVFWYAFPDAAAVLLLGLLAMPILSLVVAAEGWQPGSTVAVGWLRLAAAYGLFAVLTAVPRGRARIRWRIRSAVQAVVGKTVPVGRPKRCRWRGQHLIRADVVPPAIWRDGRDTRRAELAQQIAWRLQDGGSYVTTWVMHRGRPVARVHAAGVLPAELPAKDWRPPHGVVLIGATEPHTRGAVSVDGIPFAPWSWQRDPHLLLSGSTGNGKTAATRWLTRSLLGTAEASGKRMQLVGFDGKGAGSLAFLLHRDGVLGVADEPHEWIELIRTLEAEMNRRYAAIRAWRRGDAPQPRFGHDIGVLVDELVDIRDQAGEAFLEPFSQVVRLGREAGIHVVSSVLRPDVTDSLPGMIRASHSARLMLGTLHDEVTAKMMFGTARWRDALAASSEEDAEIPGRGIALLAGRIYRVQEPWEPDPAEDPRSSELWLPPRSGDDDPAPTPSNGPGAEVAEPAAARVVSLSTRSPKRKRVPTQRDSDGVSETGAQ